MVKNILLDTNALLWLLDSNGGKLGPKTRELITQSTTVYASAVSVLEIQIKAMLGKLTISDELLEAITKSNLEMLDMKPEHAVNIKLFPSLAKHDPFDRILLAQASTEHLIFVTADMFLLQFTDAGIEILNATV